jgi:uncharacterized paraquat-inducible protein A
LFSKALLTFAVCASVTLLPANFAVPLLALVCILQLHYTRKTRFKSRLDRFIRILYSLSNTLCHLLLVVLVLPVKIPLLASIGIGYAAICLILFNMLIDLIEVLANLGVLFYSIIQKCLEKPKSIAPK